MFYQVSGFNTNSKSINPFQGSKSSGIVKHKALHDWLDDSSGDSLESKFKKVESFNDKGERVLTYVNPYTNQPVKCFTYDSKTCNKIADCYFENGVAVRGGTYDPATGQQLTSNHYVDGVLTQIDTLDANGRVIGTRSADQGSSSSGGGSSSDDEWRYSNTMEIIYDPVTKQMAGWKSRDKITGALMAEAVYENGNAKTATTYDLETHNPTSYIEMNSVTCQPIRTATYNPTTNYKLTEKLFNDKGNLTAFNTYNGQSGELLTSSPTIPG